MQNNSRVIVMKMMPNRVNTAATVYRGGQMEANEPIVAPSEFPLALD